MELHLKWVESNKYWSHFNQETNKWEREMFNKGLGYDFNINCCPNEKVSERKETCRWVYLSF